MGRLVASSLVPGLPGAVEVRVGVLAPERPAEGVLASAAADDEDSHVRFPAIPATGSIPVRAFIAEGS